VSDQIKQSVQIMNKIIGLLVLLGAVGRVDLPAQTDLLPQRVIYIGERASEFEPFLKQHFAKVLVVTRKAFEAAPARDFDVALLDWPQGEEERQTRVAGQSPLGQREAWGKPTVLLGSAGLNLAVAWKLKGGSGCTCLAPVAYGLKDHEIFKSPRPIDIKATTNIPTPKQFASELKTPTVEVLPLVDHIRRYETVLDDYPPGWATHYYEFADVPDVEWFSGGINTQTPRSAACWRQGNLLHFGFQQSPAELNEVGRALLVNAVVYISRFTEDRPIDITPSVFGAEKIGVSRRRAKSYFSNPSYRLDWVTNIFSAALLKSFDSRNRSNALAWFETNGMWLHPGAGNYLEVDEAAQSLGTPFDAPEFIPKTIQALKDEKTRAAADRVLSRYVPDGPGRAAGVAVWETWWRENSPYMFYSELGCYRWYVDPLAKQRGVPTKELRGPARADRR
jgi:hypothetical protein